MKTKVLIIGMYETVGGIETFLLNYLKHMDTSKIDLYYLCMYDKFYFSEEIEKNGGKIVNITHIKRNPLKYLKELKMIIRREEINLVHINMLSAANIIPLLACKLIGVKHIIVHSHNTNVPSNRLKKSLHIINRRFIPLLATDFWACSKEAGEWLYGKKLPDNKKIEVINNAIEVENYIFNEQTRNEYKKMFGFEKNIVFGHVGAFREQKNQIRLIDIFSEVSHELENAVLILVGEAIRQDEIEYMNLVKKKIELLDLADKVFFLGNRNDIGKLMSMFDGMIFPSKFEGLPLVLVESQAASLPTIISKDVIPSHVKMTSYIQFESLKASNTDWVQKTLLLLKMKRIHTDETLKEKGYSIDYEANKLITLYQKIGAK